VNARETASVLELLRPSRFSAHRRPGSYRNDRPRSFFDHLVAEHDTLWIIFLEPLIGKLWRREYLEMVDVANLLVCIDMNPKRSSLAAALRTRCGHFAFAFTRNRDRPSAIRRAWARALTATTVRPRSAAMSKTETLEVMSSRSRSSSSEVQAFALFSFFASVSPHEFRVATDRQKHGLPRTAGPLPLD
jgi:hypothetical protein